MSSEADDKGIDADALRGDTLASWVFRLFEVPRGTGHHHRQVCITFVAHAGGRDSRRLPRKDEVIHNPKTLLEIALASMAVGKHDKALELIRSVEKTCWSTADYHAIAYWIKSHHSDPTAETHKTRASELHPDVIEDYAWLKRLED